MTDQEILELVKQLREARKGLYKIETKLNQADSYEVSDPIFTEFDILYDKINDLRDKLELGE